MIKSLCTSSLSTDSFSRIDTMTPGKIVPVGLLYDNGTEALYDDGDGIICGAEYVRA